MIKPADLAQRNLAWAITSPPLMNPIGKQSIWPDARWYQELKSTLARTLGQPPLPPGPHHFRLGSYFETLYIWWLKQPHGINLLEANLPVRTKTRTLGEFDLLVDNQGCTEHWEIAVKFYLGSGDLKRTDRWFGPNTADRLDLKLARLTDHQLQLSNHPVAQQLLHERNITVEKTRCIIKGRLYYPWDLFAKDTFGFLDRTNPHHQKGWWLTRTDFQNLSAAESYRWVFLQKQHWLSSVVPGDRLPEMDFTAACEFLTQPGQQQAMQLAALLDGGEVSRGFIVDENWCERVSHNSPGRYAAPPNPRTMS